MATKQFIVKIYLLFWRKMGLKIMWVDEIYNVINGFEGDLMVYKPFLPDER